MITMASTGIAAGTYAIDTTRSKIHLSTSHGFGLGPVQATLAVRAGTVIIGADPQSCAVSARVDAASFTSDKPKRDTDIRSKMFLHADAFPDLVFESQSLVAQGERWLLQGQLTVRGITAPVTLDIDSAWRDGSSCRFHARTKVDRWAYRVGVRGMLARYVDLTFDIYGTPA
jgi:polyisoprenoid-binding protein YceI